jgi:rubrerythrin
MSTSTDRRKGAAKAAAPAKGTKPGAGASASKKKVPAKRPKVSEKVRQLMIHAYAMEAEAAERYAEFADVMEVHNNAEVADLFHKMARIENLHAQQIRESMGWKTVPVPAEGIYRWEGLEAPETADHSDLHYLMTPHHALQIARLNEERAKRFYAKLAAEASDDEMRRAALEMSEEEADHVRLIDEWLARTPAPEAGWSTDLDPPNYSAD